MLTLEQGIAGVVAAMVKDYDRYQTAGGTRPKTDIQEKMFREFQESFRVDVGRKLVKIVCDNSVRAFIVKEDLTVKNDRGGYFEKGDILKPASWSAPAKNAARGNCIDGNFKWIRWTGPEYLA